MEIRDVAEELGVRYVLEGSARLSGNEVRFNAQLIDALSGGHIWAEIYDETYDDLFKMQDRVRRNIVGQIEAELNLAVEVKQNFTEVIPAEAYDLYLKGRGHFRAGSARDYANALSYLEQSLAIQPDFNRALAMRAAVYWNILNKGWWQESLDTQYHHLFELARVSLRRSQLNPTALTHQITSEWITHYSSGRRSPRPALDAADAALDKDPNSPAGYLAKANALLNDNQPREALRQVREAIRRDPHSPSEFQVRLAMAQISA